MRDADRRDLIDIAGRLERELRALGAWDEPSPGEPVGPFGAGNMAFVQWVRHVLVARLSDVIEGRAELPSASQTGVAAVRELDGWDEAARLGGALSDLDALVERVAAGRK